MTKVQKFFIILALVTVQSCATNDTPPERTVEEKKADLYYEQGTKELINANYQEALANLLKARELNPIDSKTRNNLGMAYYFRNKINLAIDEIQAAIKIDSKNTDAKLNLAAIYLEKNKLPEAKKLLDECNEDLTYPSLFRVHYNLAMVSLKEGDRKNAFNELELSIKEKEDFCLSHFKLGELYSEEYRFKEAYASYKNSIKGTCVNDPAMHFGLAQSLVNLNRNNEAIKKYNEIIEKFPKSNFSVLSHKELAHLKWSDSETRETKKDEIEPNQQTSSPKF
jgi:type IV pilus assembly protein PilF